MMLVLVDGFPEVPLEVVEASGWMDVASGRWRYRNENVIVLESALTRGVEILASTQQLYQKRCVALLDNMAVALSFESNFLVLTCIRKLASLCLALDLAVTLRWIPSETNVSEKPSSIHDPSDIRDKTMTDLLAIVVQERTHRYEMMAQRDLWETGSMIQDGNGTPCATSLKAGCKHCVSETETVMTRKSPGIKENEPFTDIAFGKATDVESENTCRRRECRDWEREGERCNVDHRGGCGDKEKANTFGKASPRMNLDNCKAWLESDPREFCPCSEGGQRAMGPRQSTKIHSNSSLALRTRKSWRSTRTTRSMRQSCCTRPRATAKYDP